MLTELVALRLYKLPIRLVSYINLIKSRFIFDELGFNEDCNLTNSGMPD